MCVALRVLALLVLATPFAAHADTIDDFTLTNGTHTITYSLPATTSFRDYNLFGVVSLPAIATIDGVPDYQTSGQYVVFPFFPFAFALNVPYMSSLLELGGGPILTYVAVPANNPYPYLPYDIVTTFTPGTYNLRLVDPDPFTPGSLNYTLTITPEAAVTPEPSTLVLLATATLAVLSRRKTKAQSAP